MKNPANRVVNRLGLVEGSMPTLVSNDPESGGKQLGSETVKGPQGNPGSSVQVRTGQIRRDVCGRISSRIVNG